MACLLLHHNFPCHERNPSSYFLSLPILHSPKFPNLKISFDSIQSWIGDFNWRISCWIRFSKLGFSIYWIDLQERMETSRRAVESYWRSRLIDSATSDEDKVAPVYKLEEICELLRSSHVSIVKEVSDFVLKRLDHKSPIVKQKV